GWKGTDRCYNGSTTPLTIIFARDTTAPVITLANASALGCNPTGAQIAAAFGAATVTDNRRSGLVASGTIGAEQGSGCSRSVTKSWTVTDGCGNVGTASQTVTFTRDDTAAPGITLAHATALGCHPGSAQIATANGGDTGTEHCRRGMLDTGMLGLA